jgi:hypothetical protein
VSARRVGFKVCAGFGFREISKLSEEENLRGRLLRERRRK